MKAYSSTKTWETIPTVKQEGQQSGAMRPTSLQSAVRSGECSNLGEAAKALGYSRRQCQRWFLTYRQEGLEELLVSRVGERGPTELVTEGAFEELEEAMKRGEIATIAQAHRFLLERGVHYAHPESVGALLRRRKVKLKTGRPWHEKADKEEQEAFKKSSPRRSKRDSKRVASASTPTNR
jgi:transposase